MSLDTTAAPDFRPFAQIKLIQTTDPSAYRRLFDITSEAVRAFCHHHQISYEPYVGIKRGCHAWHAAYNRIPLLADLVRDGFRGWAIYLDADAYPFDFGFDLSAYLRENQKWGIIAAKGGDPTWNINDGILLLNLDHPAVRSVLLQWWENFDRELPTEKLARFPDWSTECKDDQKLLHEILAARTDHTSFVKIESFAFMGWPKSRVFRQLLRITGSMEQRCAAAEAGVKQALASQ